MPELLAALLIASSLYLRKPLPKFSLNMTSSKKSKKFKQKIKHPVTETREVLDLLVLNISAGMTIPRALLTVSQTLDSALAFELGQLTKRQIMGASIKTELAKLSEQDRYWKFLANQLKLSWENGAMILENLTELGDFLIDLERSQTMKKVRSAGVRSVLPLGICFLPAFMLVVVVPLVAGLIKS